MHEGQQQIPFLVSGSGKGMEWQGGMEIGKRADKGEILLTEEDYIQNGPGAGGRQYIHNARTERVLDFQEEMKSGKGVNVIREWQVGSPKAGRHEWEDGKQVIARVTRSVKM